MEIINEHEIKKYPYLSYSPNLFEAFYVIGYNEVDIQNEIVPEFTKIIDNSLSQKEKNPILQLISKILPAHNKNLEQIDSVSLSSLNKNEIISIDNEEDTKSKEKEKENENENEPTPQENEEINTLNIDNILNNGLPSEEKNQNFRFEKQKANFKPAILNTISVDQNKNLLESDLLINLSYPDPPIIYYTDSNPSGVKPNNYEVVFFINCDSLDENSKQILHGFTYVFYQLYTTKSGYNIFVPCSFCILSQFPFFSFFYYLCKTFVEFFHKSELEIPMEVIIYNIINFTPSPINNSLFLNLFPFFDLNLYTLRINLNNLNEDDSDMNMIDKIPEEFCSIATSIPQVSGYPIFDFNLAEIFKIVSIKTLIKILIFNFLEQQMIFFSEDITKLNLSMYIISSLSFPCNDSIYLWHILSVSLDDVITVSGTNQFVSRPYTHMLGVLSSYSDDINISGNYPNSFIVDLDNNNFLYKCEKGKKISEESQDIFKLIKYIDDILNNKVVDSYFLQKTISELSQCLITFAKKIRHFFDYTENYNCEPKFFDIEALQIDTNLKIQESFYNFVLNILKVFYSFNKYKGVKRKKTEKKLERKLSTSSINSQGSNNNEEMKESGIKEYKEFIEKSDVLSNELLKDELNDFINIDNKDIKLNIEEVINKPNENNDLIDDIDNEEQIENSDNFEEEIEEEPVTSNKQTKYLTYSLNIKKFSKEERTFFDLFKESSKFSHYIFSFIQTHECLDLYKIPLLFSEEFILLKKVDEKKFNNNFFQMMKNFYIKTGQTSNPRGSKSNIKIAYSKSEYNRLMNESFDIESSRINIELQPNTGINITVDFFDFYRYYNKELKTKFSNFKLNSNISIKKVLSTNSTREKVYYEYKNVILDQNLVNYYVYLLNNIPEEEKIKIIPSLYMIKQLDIGHIKPREITNSVEKSLLISKNISIFDLLFYSMILIFTIFECDIENEYFIDIFLELISKRYYCIRKYLTFILNMYYRKTEKEINLYLNERKTINFEIINVIKRNIKYYNKFFDHVKERNILPDTQMLYIFEQMDMLQTKIDFKVDENENILYDKTKKKLWDKFYVSKNYCYNGTVKEKYFYKLTRNLTYDGFIRYECDHCNKAIIPLINIKFTGENKKRYHFQSEIYSPLKVYIETNKLMEKYYYSLDKKDINIEGVRKILVNFIFYSIYGEKHFHKNINSIFFLFLGLIKDN